MAKKKSVNPYTKISKTNVNTLHKSVTGENKAIKEAYKRSVKMTNGNFDNSEKQAYTLYNQGQRELGRQLDNNVSGTTKNKLEVNYGGNLETNNIGRAAALGSAATTMKNNKAAAVQNYYTKKAAVKQDAGESKIKRDDTIRKNKLATYKTTTGRYTTVAEVNKAIKQMKKSKDMYKKAKIAYLIGQRSKLQEAAAVAAAKAARSSSSGSSRSYSRSYSSGSGSSSGKSSGNSSGKSSGKSKKTNWNNLYGYYNGPDGIITKLKNGGSKKTTKPKNSKLNHPSQHHKR